MIARSAIHFDLRFGGHLAACTLFALPVAVLLHTGSCQGSELKAPEQSSQKEGNGGSAGAVQADSLVLVNRTDTAFVALAFHPKTARPLKEKIEVDLSAKRASDNSPFYVAAGDSTALWPCESLDDYEGYTLHLYQIPADGEGVVSASLVRSERLTAERLNAARRQRCRLSIDEL